MHQRECPVKDCPHVTAGGQRAPEGVSCQRLSTRHSGRTTCTRGCVLSKTVHPSQREDNVHQRVCPVKDCPHVTAGEQHAPEGVSCQRLSTRHSGKTTCTRGCVLSKTVHMSQRENNVHQRVCPVKDCPHVTAGGQRAPEGVSCQRLSTRHSGRTTCTRGCVLSKTIHTSQREDNVHQRVCPVKDCPHVTAGEQCAPEGVSCQRLSTRHSGRTTCTRGCVLSKTVHTSQREDNVHQRVCPVKDCPLVTAGGQRAPEGVSYQRLSTRHSGRTMCTRGCVLSKTVHTSQREDNVHQRVCPVKECPHFTAGEQCAPEGVSCQRMSTPHSGRTTCTRGCVLSKTVHTSQRENNVHQRVCPVKDCPHVTAGGQRAPEGVSCQRLSTRHSGRTTCTRGCVLSKTVHTSQREDNVHQRLCPVKDAVCCGIDGGIVQLGLGEYVYIVSQRRLHS